MTRLQHLLSTTLATPLLFGCATPWPLKPAADDVAQNQKERKAELVESFEKKRDEAQFEAAMVRWKEGDAGGSRELVDKLLARSPKHRRARLLLAEFRLLEDKPELAIADIEKLLVEDKDDAEAVHMLGLLLESAGRAEEAIVYFERASQLAPDSEVFASSYQTALVGEPMGDSIQASDDRPQPTTTR